MRSLAAAGVAATGGTPSHGAFVTIDSPRARAWCAALAVRGVIADARGRYLRLGPDILTTEHELAAAAAAIAAVAG